MWYFWLYRQNKVFDVFLETGDLKEATFILQIVTFQLLAYFLFLSKGLKDPDKPLNLAKSVTVKYFIAYKWLRGYNNIL